MRLIAIGKLGRGPEADLFADYASRIRPALETREITPATGSPGEIRKREGEALIAALSARDIPVALDMGGSQIGSEAFAALLQAWLDSGRSPAFMIGGAEGLAEAVTTRAQYTLSLGTMTWPHMLVRIMLAEQIFRAQCIATGHPYHRGFRP
jgi:23S rRNA (pseudouridine1915-N3)-methyltransferase